MNKLNIKGLNLAELESLVTALSEKKYRAQQIFKWIYSKGVNSFDEMTNLSKALRIKVAAHAQISKLTLLATRQSMKDNTHKFLFQLVDGFKIESVLMFDRQRTTLCVSTQVGCAIDCKFCATGGMGLQRDLTAGEIVDQLLTVQALTGETISHVVCMGMGEPFHNYDNVMKACA
ncbi:MAG: 23S rRNA (adenine(2503)-C(2))-methyltransferase RlmN, partial [bacterium]